MVGGGWVPGRADGESLVRTTRGCRHGRDGSKEEVEGVEEEAGGGEGNLGGWTVVFGREAAVEAEGVDGRMGWTFGRAEERPMLELGGEGEGNRKFEGEQGGQTH